MAGLAKLLGVRIYELNRSNLFVLFSPQMNFCGLRLGSAFDCFFGRDPWLFPPPRPAPACRVVVAEKSLLPRGGEGESSARSPLFPKRVYFWFFCIMGGGPPLLARPPANDPHILIKTSPTTTTQQKKKTEEKQHSSFSSSPGRAGCCAEAEKKRRGGKK